eukprot:412106-Prorocentrum_minimum.AAC.1
MGVIQNFALDECLHTAHPREFEGLMATKYDQTDQQARLFFVTRATRDEWADGPVAGRRTWVPKTMGIREDGLNSLVVT